MATIEEQTAQLEATIAHMETQRATLGDAAVEVALSALRQQLSALRQTLSAEPAPSLKGERKLVTIMFADISGFTALAETMDPEAVRDLMNACFERLVPVVEKYEGTVDKFMGDNIMALFGAPVAHENDPERALHAALEMMDELAAFNLERETDLGLHFGINTGLVIAGSLGTRERQEYSVMGDAVNLAARLEDASERGEIFVGPDTYRLAALLFEFEALEPIQVKGKAEPVPVYRLLAAKAVRGKVRGIEGLDSPLVGRGAEFRALQEAIERLQAGVGGIVTLVGEAGLGKSRLVAEIRNSQLAIRNSDWLEGRCLSYGGSIAYLLWLDMLRGLVGAAPDDAPPAVRDALRERVQALCPDCLNDVFPYLARMMSLPLDDEVEAAMRDLEGEKLRSGTFDAVETLVEAAARQRPLVVVCEDLHWADPTSIELLEKLLSLADRAPLLFLCVFRPEKEHSCWRIKETAARLYRHRHTDLWLEPLSAAESEALVGNLLRVEDLPRELRERILDHAEGNPFYVEEIIRSLMDGEAIRRDEATGRWRATRDVADIAIPDTLHGVLMARIDRLQEETKRVLQLASVIGRIFFYRVLVAIARAERELNDHLLTLQREEMIRERARVPELEYIFKHELTREAAYNGLLKKERRVFHRQVAEALEWLFPDRIEEQVGLLAHHWERAEEPEKAIEYLQQAGDQARLAYAHEEAVDYYERALKLLKEQGQYERAARTLMKLGLTCHTAFDFERARRAYDEGFALWQQAGEIREETSLPPATHTFRVGGWHEFRSVSSLDPARVVWTTEGMLVSQFFSGLLTLSPEMEVTPNVAQSWQVLEGGHQYVFHLRDDVRWSDGRQVTAKDFEYAWKRNLNPVGGAENASHLYDIKGARTFHQGVDPDPDSVGVRALDEVTLFVELEEPTAYFLYLLASCTAAFPVPRHAVEAYGEKWTEVGNFVTNGPFELETWQQGEFITLVRNSEFHGRFSGNLQRVEVSFLSEQSALEMYEADGLDILYMEGFSSPDIDRARRRHAEEYITKPEPVTFYVNFDINRPPFDDVRVRRAFVLAADRKELADVVLTSLGSPATGGFVPPAIPGHSAGISLPYDPERAWQLLAEAGYPDGRGFPIVNGFGILISEYLQAQWRENLKIEVVWEVPGNIPYWDGWKQVLPHMWFIGFEADYPDPESLLGRFIPQDERDWRNDAYIGLIEQAKGTMDQDERMKMYRQADRLLMEEARIMPIVYTKRHMLIKSWVTKYPLAPHTNRWFLKDVVIGPH